jgi:hypothetical protein
MCRRQGDTERMRKRKGNSVSFYLRSPIFCTSVSEHKIEKEDDRVGGREAKIEVLNVKMVYVITET